MMCVDRPGRVAALCALGAFCALSGLAALAMPARAEDPSLLPAPLGVSETFASDQATGLAIGGFDPVSYSLDAQPRPGLATRSLVWSGHLWRFASGANLEAFRRDPAAFAPRIGGYDAERMAEGVRVPADPAHYLVRPGALYLFRTPQHRARFLADESLQARAEAEWRRVLPGLIRG